MREVPDQTIDDLVRTVAIIAASANPSPNGGWTYTARQHQACVESCQAVLRKHNLRNWQVTTSQQAEG